MQKEPSPSGPAAPNSIADEVRAYEPHLTPILSTSEWRETRSRVFDWEISPMVLESGNIIPGYIKRNCTQINTAVFSKDDPADRLRAIGELKATMEAVINSDQKRDFGDDRGIRPRRTAGLNALGRRRREDVVIRFIQCFIELPLVDDRVLLIAEWGLQA